KRGYQITAVDLSAEQLEVNRQNLVVAGLESQVRFVAADARDMSSVVGEFDAVLLMGPLYHLIVEADRKLVLKHMFDRLRTGGVIVSAILSRFGVMSDLLRNKPEWIEDRAEVESILTNGKRPDEAPRGGFRAYLSGISEIRPLHEALGFET